MTRSGLRDVAVAVAAALGLGATLMAAVWIVLAALAVVFE